MLLSSDVNGWRPPDCRRISYRFLSILIRVTLALCVLFTRYCLLSDSHIIHATFA